MRCKAQRGLAHIVVVVVGELSASRFLEADPGARGIHPHLRDLGAKRGIAIAPRSGARFRYRDHACASRCQDDSRLRAHVLASEWCSFSLLRLTQRSPAHRCASTSAGCRRSGATIRTAPLLSVCGGHARSASKRTVSGSSSAWRTGRALAPSVVPVPRVDAPNGERGESSRARRDPFAFDDAAASAPPNDSRSSAVSGLGHAVHLPGRALPTAPGVVES